MISKLVTTHFCFQMLITVLCEIQFVCLDGTYTKKLIKLIFNIKKANIFFTSVAKPLGGLKQNVDTVKLFGFYQMLINTL